MQDIENGLIGMPQFQKNSWLQIQKDDRVHSMFLSLVAAGKIPEKKKRKGDFTNIKRLHNLYRTGQLKISPDGFVTVRHIDNSGNTYEAISIPTTFSPGLVHALHIKLNHPSKTQMQRLLSRYFYCPGQSRIIEEVCSSCSTCIALKEIS